MTRLQGFLDQGSKAAMWLGTPLGLLSYVLACMSVQPDSGQLGLGSSEISQQIVYLDSRKRSGVAIGRLLRMGQYNPSLPDPFMVQNWSHPIMDCSNETFDCIKAGKIIIFSPITSPLPNQTYSYMNRSAHVIGCDWNNVCTIEITGKNSDNSPSLVVYFRRSNRGIVSLGFEPSPGNARRASNRFRLVGSAGLFARGVSLTKNPGQ